MSSKLLTNLWEEGKLPTIDTVVKLDAKPIIEGTAVIGIALIICVMLFILFRERKLKPV